MNGRRVLLCEGSSLSLRQTITSLGCAGYHLELCDPDPFCLGRFSRFVRAFHRCPAVRQDPTGYLDFVLELLRTRRYEAILPTHEQAFLFSKVSGAISLYAGLAVSAFEAFEQVQSKVRFFKLLSALSIPHPVTRIVSHPSELSAVQRFPCFVKAEFGTATAGVWRIASARDVAAVISILESRGLPSGSETVIVQENATGVLERTQTVFDRGRLIA
jgi:carbamoylphosphate synthase large subunit